MADPAAQSLIELGDALLHAADRLEAVMNAFRRGEIAAADLRAALHAALEQAALVGHRLRPETFSDAA